MAPEDEEEDNSSEILSASMAILPRTAYSIVFRLDDIVSIVRRFVLGGSVGGGDAVYL